MRPIDADELKERWTIASPEPYNTDSAEVIDSIDSAHTLDVAAIVRCKDCKYFKLWRSVSPTCTYWTDWWDMKTDPDGFCYHGEKKDDQ